MIIRDHGASYAFIHNPRTSGSSITNFLLEYCGGKRYSVKSEIEKQYNVHRVYASGPEKIKHYYKFGFVRNPFSRELSLYKLLMKNNSFTFKEWIISRFSDSTNKNYESILLYYKLPQFGYFCDINGELDVNVFRYEERDTALKIIGDNIKVNMSNIGRFRPSKNSPRFDIGDYRNEYDYEMVSLIEEAYRVDLDNFGYTFEGFKPPEKKTFKFNGAVELYISNYETGERFNKYK